MHNEGFSETVKPTFLKRNGAIEDWNIWMGMWYNNYHRHDWFFSLWWIGFLVDWIIWTESTGVNSRCVQNQSALKSGVPGINVGSLHGYRKYLRIGIYCIPWKGLFTKTWHNTKTGSKLTENKPHWLTQQSLWHLDCTPQKYFAIL